MSKKNEKYLIDQVILHSQLYKKYQYKENEIGFYDNLKQLQDLIGATCLDTALDYAILKAEEALNTVKEMAGV